MQTNQTYFSPELFIKQSFIADANPKKVFIEPTSRCNTRCMHCPHYHQNYGEDIAEAVADKAIHELLDSADVIIAQGGGEPLIAKSFHDILEVCGEKGKHVSFVTNAIMLRDRDLVRKLVRLPVSMGISIDGAHEETFNFVRPHIKWSHMLESLDMVRECRKDAGAECRASVFFISVAMKDTFGDLPDLVRLAHKYDIDSISVQALMGDNHTEKLRDQSPFLSPDIVAAASLEGMAAARELGIGLELPVSFYEIAGNPKYSKDLDLSRGARRVLNKMKKADKADRSSKSPDYKWGLSPCSDPWNSVFITAAGHVAPCCLQAPYLGDLKTQEWKDIWNSNLYQSFRRQVHSWNPPAACRGCTMQWGINGGDDTRYSKYFEQFEPKPVSIQGGQVEFDEEFEKIQGDEGSSRWRLSGKSGTLTIKGIPENSEFLRFTIHAVNRWEPVPGECTINDGESEPFDLSCNHIHFPIHEVSNDELKVIFDMANYSEEKLVITAVDFL